MLTKDINYLYFYTPLCLFFILYNYEKQLIELIDALTVQKYNEFLYYILTN